MQIQNVSVNSVFKTFNTALQADKQNKAGKNNTPNPAKSFIQQYKTPAILVTGGLALAVLTGVLVNKQNNYLAKKAKEELKALAEKSKQEETEKIQICWTVWQWRMRSVWTAGKQSGLQA